MTIRKRITRRHTKRKVRTLEDYLANLPEAASPEARMTFTDMVNKYVLPYQKRLRCHGYPVTVYPLYRTELNKDSKYISVTSVQVGFRVQEKPQDVIVRLNNNRDRWTQELFVAALRLERNGFTPKK